MDEYIEGEQEQEQMNACGLVMIDDEYYFKIQQKQYIFGKVKKVEDINCKTAYIDMLYPSTIENVFKYYFRYKQADMCHGKLLTIRELQDIVKEIRETIKNIERQLSN